MKWYRDTRHRIVPVEVEGRPEMEDSTANEEAASAEAVSDRKTLQEKIGELLRQNENLLKQTEDLRNGSEPQLVPVPSGR